MFGSFYYVIHINKYFLLFVVKLITTRFSEPHDVQRYALTLRILFMKCSALVNSIFYYTDLIAIPIFTKRLQIKLNGLLYCQLNYCIMMRSI